MYETWNAFNNIPEIENEILILSYHPRFTIQYLKNLIHINNDIFRIKIIKINSIYKVLIRDNDNLLIFIIECLYYNRIILSVI